MRPESSSRRFSPILTATLTHREPPSLVGLVHALVLAVGLAGMALPTMVQAGPQAERVYLSGPGPSEAVEWDFHVSGGRRSGEWATIPVPSNWEQHGFGGYDYGHVPADEKHDEIGTYRTTFEVPAEWENRVVRLVFDGAMTETAIKVNGQSVGKPHQGGYLPFRFLLHAYNQFRDGQMDQVLKFGEINELEVTVAKKPSNLSVDLAERRGDYWVFGGIYRPVYLEVLPLNFVDRVAIDARADGHLTVEAFPQQHHDIITKRMDAVTPVDAVEVSVLKRDGTPIGEPVTLAIPGPVNRVRLQAHIDSPDAWTPETPYLYRLRTRLLRGYEILHEQFDSFGFRTIELRPGDGLYLNGVRILVKGVNRNGMHADTARAIDPVEAWRDARLIKLMNANLVRHHMPPSAEFMEACDRLGLLVMTELTTWQRPAMDTPMARNLAYELVTTYHNHPSYVMWANGNEGGFNKEIDELYALYDLQDRPAYHPWALFNGIDAMHYGGYAQFARALSDRPHVVLSTEFLHGLYDGGHGAGLADYWKLIETSPVAAGGVLWCWADAGVARTDREGWIDTGGNWSADGIVGPRREKEASYFTIREIWSPVQVPLKAIPPGFDGRLPVSNGYFFSTLAGTRLAWSLVDHAGPRSGQTTSTIGAQGQVELPPLAPGKAGRFELGLPHDWAEHDTLAVRAIDASGDELMHWSWPLRHDVGAAATAAAGAIEKVAPMTFQAGAVTWQFDQTDGRLVRSTMNGTDTGLGGGPFVYAATTGGAIADDGTWTVRSNRDGETVVLKAIEAGSGSSFSWTLHPDGRAQLDYDFTPPDEAVTYCAVGFDLPAEQVKAKRWLGEGPHRASSGV